MNPDNSVPTNTADSVSVEANPTLAPAEVTAVDASAPGVVTDPPAKPVPAYVDLGVAVKERIAGCGADVREVIVASLAKDEIARRTTVGEAAIRLETELAKEFGKIKPDVTEYATPGDEKTAVKRWSPEHGKKYQEASKKLEELRSSINTAFDKFDKESWDKLEQKVKGLKDSAASAEKSNDQKKK